MVPVDSGSILVTALISPALVRWVFRDTYSSTTAQWVRSKCEKTNQKSFFKLYPNLILNAAGIVDNSHTSGAGSNIQPLNDFCQEDFNLLKLWGANTATAVDDEHEVGGTGFAQTCRYTWREKQLRCHRNLIFIL